MTYEPTFAGTVFAPMIVVTLLLAGLATWFVDTTEGPRGRWLAGKLLAASIAVTWVTIGLSVVQVLISSSVDVALSLVFTATLVVVLRFVRRVRREFGHDL